MHKTILLSGLVALLALSSGCTGGQIDTRAAEESKPKIPPPNCIGVLPAQAVATNAANTSLLSAATPTINGILRETLGSNRKCRFVDASQATPLQAPGAMATLEPSRAVAQTVGCSALLATELSRFVERDGGPYGVRQPAAITVSYRLYDVQTGMSFCHGRFDEQQESLMENLFSIGKAGKRGMTWLTAEELAREGLQARLGDCPYLGN